MTDPESPEHESRAHPRRDFLIAYVFWVVVFLSIAVSIWLSSSELSAFRYAGF
ncbi:MAG: hypothetical protein R2707_12200 [Acidimicrobiales bacterium]